MTRCWLCYRPLGPEDDILLAQVLADRPAKEIAPRASAVESVFAWLTVATVGLVLLVILGSLRDSPGFALIVALCTLPALVATGMLIAVRSASGKSFSWTSTFATFAGTLGTVMLVVLAVIVIVIVTIIALIASLFATCAELLNGMGGG